MDRRGWRATVTGHKESDTPEEPRAHTHPLPYTSLHFPAQFPEAPVSGAPLVTASNVGTSPNSEMPLRGSFEEVRLCLLCFGFPHSTEISEASLQTTILIRPGKKTERERKRKKETRGEGRGKEGELGCFSVGGCLQSPGGASSVLKSSRSERPLTINGQSSWSQKEMSKGGPLLPTLLPLAPEHQHQTGIHSVYMYLPPPAGCKPHNSRGFFIIITILYFFLCCIFST